MNLLFHKLAGISLVAEWLWAIQDHPSATCSQFISCLCTVVNPRPTNYHLLCVRDDTCGISAPVYIIPCSKGVSFVNVLIYEDVTLTSEST